jgi:HK97 family phage prohead protease
MTTKSPIQGREWRFCDYLGFELRDAADVDSPGSPGQLVGHAAVFNVVTDLGRFREMVAPGAFKDSIKKDDVRALLNHNPDHILGRTAAKTLKLKEDDKGLAIEIKLPKTQTARDLVESILRGDISQMSFAFDTIEDSWGRDAEGNQVRTLRKVKLFDVSPVTSPAYPQTDIALRWASAPPRGGQLSIMRMRLELEALI